MTTYTYEYPFESPDPSPTPKPKKRVPPSSFGPGFGQKHHHYAGPPVHPKPTPHPSHHVKIETL